MKIPPVAARIASFSPALLFLLAPEAQLQAQDPSAALSQAVRPFLQKNCIGCHTTAMPSGNVDMQQLLAAPNSLTTSHDTWDDIGYQIRSGLMPPQGAPKPDKTEADAALELISRAVAASPRATQPGAAAQASNQPATKDWLTFSYDGERTGWARGETKIAKATASKLELKWRLQTDAKPDPGNKYMTLTDPLVVNNVPTRDGPKKMLYVGSNNNSIYAIDADKGSVVWKRDYPNTMTPKVPQTGQCGNNMNATPVIDPKSGILYFLPNDGKLRGVSIIDGEDRFPATEILPAYTRNFSLNLVDGVIFTSTTRGCQREVSEIVGINVVDAKHEISHFYTSTGKGSGVWGRGGLVETPFGVIGQTADGANDPAAGRWGSSVVGLNKMGRLVDSFIPADQYDLDARDFDLGSSSPVVFPYGGRTMVALSAKEGKIYLLDAKSLGGKDHHTPLYLSPRWSNDAMLFGFNGMWSVLSTYVDKQGRRWILAPYYGPAAKDTVGQFKKQHGPTVNGELMAFTVEGPADHPTLVPQWVSADLDLPGVAVVANDVILILSNGDRASAALGGPGGRGGGDMQGEGGGGGGGGRGGRGPGGGAAAGGRGGRGGGGGAGTMYDADAPGAERDQAWLDSQRRPWEEGGQKGGTRFSGGRDTTHAILYAIDPETGDELYSSGNAIDSWNHYGGLAVSDGNIYVSTWDARVYAFSVKP